MFGVVNLIFRALVKFVYRFHSRRGQRSATKPEDSRVKIPGRPFSTTFWTKSMEDRYLTEPRVTRDLAVLLAVYGKDDPVRFFEVFDSIRSQTVGFNRIGVYLGIDGPLPPELRGAVDAIVSQCVAVVESPFNRGLAKTLNDLVNRLGPEEYIFRVDADDANAPTRFAIQLSALEQDPSVGVIGGAVQERYPDGFIKIRSLPTNHAVLMERLPLGVPVLHPTVCFRRMVLANAEPKPYPEDVGPNEDVGLWFRLAERGIQFANVQDVLVHSEIDGAFFTRRSVQKSKNEFRVYNAGLRRLGFRLPWRFLPVLRLVFRFFPARFARHIYRRR